MPFQTGEDEFSTSQISLPRSMYAHSCVCEGSQAAVQIVLLR